jgi:hypothetical protein
MGATLLAFGVLVTATATTASASAPHGVPVIPVPCDATSLADAVAAANVTPAVLRLASHCVYDLTAQLPQITGNVTLVGGPGTVIRHDPATAANFRLLDVAGAGRLQIMGVFLRDGNPVGDGGAIRNAGWLMLNLVTIDNNLAGLPLTAGGNGGGLANLAGGRAVVAHTLITANEAFRTLAETTTGNGGGIDNAGILTLFETRLVANTATSAVGAAGTGNGGGVNTRPGGRSLVIRSSLLDDDATNNGGGVCNAGGTTLIRSLILRNRATAGGGVFGTATLRRSIVRGNTPDNCDPPNPRCD